MISQRTVRDTLADERGDRDQAAVAQPKFVGTAPDLTEKNVVVKFREFGREGAELLAASCLLDFSCAIIVVLFIASAASARMILNFVLFMRFFLLVQIYLEWFYSFVYGLRIFVPGSMIR